jgi:hypothetical protein
LKADALMSLLETINKAKNVKTDLNVIEKTPFGGVIEHSSCV